MSIFMVDATTVEAINGIRARGFYANVTVTSTTDNAYELRATADNSLQASVDSSGVITYPAAQEAVTNG